MSAELLDTESTPTLSADVVGEVELFKTASNLIEASGAQSAEVTRDLSHSPYESESGITTSRRISLMPSAADSLVRIKAEELIKEKGDGIVVTAEVSGFGDKLEQASGAKERALRMDKFLVFPDGAMYLVRNQAQKANAVEKGDLADVSPVEFPVYQRVNGYLMDFDGYPEARAKASELAKAA
jgi:hypothetical protein